MYRAGFKLFAFITLSSWLISGFATESQLDALTEAVIQGSDEQVITIFEHNSDLSSNPFAFRMYVNSLMSVDLDKAEEQIEQAVNTHTNDYKLQMIFASVMGEQASNSMFKALGYAKKAKLRLENAVALEPDNVFAYFGVLGFHIHAPSIAGGDLEEAEKIASKMLAMDEQVGTIAKIQLKHEKELDIADDLKNGIDDYSDSLSFLDFAANQYAAIEQTEMAQSVYKKIINLPIESVSKEVLSEDKHEQQLELARNFSRILNARYQFAKHAIESGNNLPEAIDSMLFFIKEIPDPKYAKRDLPSLNWAKLRLVELYLINGNAKLAHSTFADIGKEDDKRFKKLYKALKKKV